jgi:tetratricopeptide (TPR) repeat protein
MVRSSLVVAFLMLSPALAQTICYTHSVVLSQPMTPSWTGAQEEDEFQKVFTNARRLMLQHQYTEAIKEFKKAAQLRGNQCAECFQFIAQIHFLTQELKEAATAYRQAIVLKPQNEAELNNALGVTLYLQGNEKALAEAAAAFKRAIELSNGKVAKAYYNLGITLIKLGKKDEGITALKEYLKINPGSYEVSKIIENPSLAGVTFAPAFNVTSTSGEQLSLEKLRGKVVLLDFWASWCGPCRFEMPFVKRIWSKYGSDERFAMIGIDLDENREMFEQYVKKEKIAWPQYFDGQGWGNSIARLYGVRAIPYTVLIDHDGVIRAVGLRGGDLIEEIEKLLKKMPKK